MSTTQQLAVLRKRQIALLRDLVSRGRAKTPEEHRAAGAIADQLDGLQAEINRLRLGERTRELNQLFNDRSRSKRNG